MFGKKMSKDTMAHIAEVSLGSGLDYFHAAVRSGRSERAAFLVLAHVQSAGAALLYAQLQSEDKSFKDRFEFTGLLERSLRYEVFRLAEVGATAGSGPFPTDELLRETADRSLSRGDEPVALKLGTQTCWEGPFANVHQDAGG